MCYYSIVYVCHKVATVALVSMSITDLVLTPLQRMLSSVKESRGEPLTCLTLLV